ncbi:MAG: elongation factor P [Candidatus Omnitrophica bacterium]|nr:elongation factor P [Candidatus Omnitrophota bacterium]MCM8793177.1 elongation factor P [Candidatus Omnitrophota bacterium]
MITTNQFKTGLTLLIEGEVYSIVEYEHVKPGKGSAFVRTKLRNLRTQAVIERTYRAGEKFEEAFIEEKRLNFLYRSGDLFYFMDEETYEQKAIAKEDLKNTVNFIKENTPVTVAYFENRIISVNPPNFVELKVEYTEPGLKGDTAKATYKPARLETGYILQVPLFIENGDIIKVDTRTGEYVARIG